MRKQTGFTLIEIAIVLVIIGLLLGGVLKGQELIQSARVRNLAAMTDGTKAAFFGFQDRFRALPGDYTGALATANILGVAANAGCTGAVTGGGNGDGQIAAAGESIIAWEHLSKAGFITGSYTCAAATNAATNTPTNVYGAYVQLVYDGIYGITSGGTVRHNLKTGPSIPVAIIAELDRKVDDGAPYAGSFQFSVYAGTGGTAPTEAGSCTSAAAAGATWQATTGVTNCGGATLF
ncbi:MAG: prepilin-type N-terminal cleavage/methylation domain-containing protein [Pseudomonadota bacterium]